MRKLKYRVIKTGLEEYIIQSKEGLFGDWMFQGNTGMDLEYALAKLRDYKETQEKEIKTNKLARKILRVWT